MVSLQVSATAWEQSGLGEGLGTEERKVQPLPPPWLESLIQEAPSCPAVLGCGGIYLGTACQAGCSHTWEKDNSRWLAG